MKKKICLLLTLVISIFMFSGRVEAAKELTCIYEGNVLDSSIMLSQNASGNIKIYNNEWNETSLDSKYWRDFTNFGFKFDTSKYDNEVKELTDCPKYKSTLTFEGSKILFHDENKGFWYSNHELVDSIIGESSDSVAMQTFKHPSFHLEEINSTEWIGRCVYAFSDTLKLELYFNDDKYIVANYMSGHTNARFSLKNLMSVVNDAKACPPYLYLYSTTTVNQMGATRIDDLYLFASDRVGLTGIIGGSEFSKSDIPFIDGKVNLEFEVPIEPEPIVDCADLLGPEMLEQINKIMDIVKIIIPILLIGFGILDFTKAIFASSPEEMNKNKKVFFNRILAAILVFIAPIFINLILSLANEVWGYISPNACIEQQK